MSRQICVKSFQSSKSLKKMYDEAVTYLESLGFKKEPILAVTDNESTARSYLFMHGTEKIIFQYKLNLNEESLVLGFTPMDVEFIYDILLMRFRQLSLYESGKVFIYT